METPSTISELNAYIKKSMENSTAPTGAESLDAPSTPQAKKASETNQQLIKVLHDNYFTVAPEDKIIRHGNTVILQKPIPNETNPDGSQKYKNHILELTQNKF